MTILAIKVTLKSIEIFLCILFLNHHFLKSVSEVNNNVLFTNTNYRYVKVRLMTLIILNEKQ